MSDTVALVTKTEKSFMWLRIRRDNSCGGCNSNSNCGIASLGRLFSAKDTVIKVTNNGVYEQGDKVLIEYADKDLPRAAFWVYVLPIIIFFVFAWGGNFLNSVLSLESELLVVLFSILGLQVAGTLLNFRKPMPIKVIGHYHGDKFSFGSNYE